MKKIKMGICLSGCLILIFSAASAEEVKVVTYYPAPYSEYKEMNTSQNTNLATNNTATGGVPDYKVGIGTTAPAQKLDVDGNVKFSGALMPNGGAGTAGQVLTSQGPGAAPMWSWGKFAEFVKNDSQVTIPASADLSAKVELPLNLINFGSGFSLDQGGILVPAAGFYFIHVSAPLWLYGTGFNGKAFSFEIVKFLDGYPALNQAQVIQYRFGTFQQSVANINLNVELSRFVKLAKNDRIAVTFTHAGPATNTNGVTVKGYLNYPPESFSVSILKLGE